MKTTTAFPALLFLFALVTTPIPSTASTVLDENSNPITSNGGPYYFLGRNNYQGLQVAKIGNDECTLSVVQASDWQGGLPLTFKSTDSDHPITTDQLVNIEFVGIAGSNPSHWVVDAQGYVQVGYNNEKADGLFKLKQPGQIGEGYQILYCPDSDSDDACKYLTLVSANDYKRLALGDVDNSWKVVFRPVNNLRNTCRCPRISTFK